MKFKDFCTYGGGRLVYLWNVAGYPWVLTSSSSFDPTSFTNFNRVILGGREADDGFYPASDIKYVHGVLNPPNSIKYDLDDNSGMIEGGQYSIKVDRRHHGLDWSDFNWPSSYAGIPGLDFTPEIGATEGIGWGYVSESAKSDAITITYRDQSNDILTDWIITNSGGYLWIGNECVYCDGIWAGSDGQVVLNIPDGTLTFDTYNARGCFRTRPQGHYIEEASGVSPIVSNVPLGSVAGRACYLWATVVDDAGDIILDEGAFCVSHGRVQPHVKIKDDQIQVPIEPWINHLKQDIPIKGFEGHMGGYLFSRRNDDTDYDIPDYPDSNFRNTAQCPHLLYRQWNVALDGWINYGIWLCAKDSTVFFRTKNDVILALQMELAKCSEDIGTGTPNTTQLSGDATAGWVAFGNYLKIANSKLEPNRLVLSEVPRGFVHARFAGPCAFLFGLCDYLESEVDSIKEALSTGHPIDALNNGLPAFMAVAGNYNDDLEADDPAAVNADFGDSSYLIQSTNSPESYGNFSTNQNYGNTRVNNWMIPEHQSENRIYLNEFTDMTSLDANDYVQFGSQDDEAEPYRALMGNPTSKGVITDGNNPYMAFDYETTAYLKTGLGDTGTGVAPILQRPDLNDPSPMRPLHSLYWLSNLEEKDPWLISGNQVTITAKSLGDLLKGLIGFIDTDLPVNQSSKVNFIPDIGDPDAVDQITSIDWDSLDEACSPVTPGHYYSLPLRGGKVNLYKLLEGELQFHGVTMTLEPYTSGTGGNWIIRFRKRGDVNISESFAQGRLIDSTNIVTGDAQQASHNKTWKFSQILANCNFNGKEYENKFMVDSRFARARIGGVVTQEINAQMSNVPTGFSQDALAAEAAMYGHFVPLLVHSSQDKPVVTKGLTSKSMYYVNLGRDALLTDETTYDLNTGARGIVNKPCTVKSVEYVLGKSDYGMNVDLSMSSSGVYGWAPSMICNGSSSIVISEGAAGTVSIIPFSHYFTRSDDRTDLSYFRNVYYNQATEDYVVGASDPDFKVLVMSQNDPTWVPVAATIGTFNAAHSTAVLTMNTAGFTIVSDRIVEDLYIKFAEWDDVEPEQRRWFALADGDNLIGTGAVQVNGHRWQV